MLVNNAISIRLNLLIEHKHAKQPFLRLGTHYLLHEIKIYSWTPNNNTTFTRYVQLTFQKTKRLYKEQLLHTLTCFCECQYN